MQFIIGKGIFFLQTVLMGLDRRIYADILRQFHQSNDPEFVKGRVAFDVHYLRNYMFKSDQIVYALCIFIATFFVHYSVIICIILYIIVEETVAAYICGLYVRELDTGRMRVNHAINRFRLYEIFTAITTLCIVYFGASYATDIHLIYVAIVWFTLIHLFFLQATRSMVDLAAHTLVFTILSYILVYLLNQKGVVPDILFQFEYFALPFAALVMLCVVPALFFHHYRMNAMKAERTAAHYRKNAEQSLERLFREHELLEVSQDSIDNGIALCDENGAIFRMNQSLCKVLGVEFISLGHSKLSEIIPAEFLRADGVQREYRTPNGRSILIEGKQLTRFKTHDEASQYFYYLVDDTVRRHDQEVKMRNDKQVALGRLATAIAHDMNNFLAIMQTQAELIYENHDKPSFEDHHQEFTKAMNGCKNLSARLENFMRSSPIRKEAVFLTDVIDATVNKFNQETGNQNRIILGRVDKITVECDPDFLVLAISNILRNAIEASAAGANIFLSATKQARGQAVLEVVDNGCGIPKKYMDRVFDPFFTLKSAQGSIGMGINTVLKFANSVNGDFRITSYEGHGTQARLILPTCEDQSREASTVIKFPRPQNETVLIVDDNIAFAKALSAQIARLGFRVITAATSYDIEKMSEFQSITTVLCDMILLGETGFDVYHLLKEKDVHARFIFMSGNFSDEIRKQLLSMNDVEMVDKPLTSNVIKHLLLRATGSE